MRLSEAIRLGAMATEQATDSNFISHGKTCALGAALYAVGRIATLFDGFSLVEAEFPICLLQVRHPVNSKDVDDLDVVIADLNDCHGWTREQIADWVEGIERTSLGEAGCDSTKVTTAASASAEEVLVLKAEPLSQEPVK